MSNVQRPRVDAVSNSAPDHSQIDATVSSLKQEAERYLTVKQVAQRFSVTPQTVWRWSKQGPSLSFPRPVRIGYGTTRWRLSDILRYERLTEGL